MIRKIHKDNMDLEFFTECPSPPGYSFITVSDDLAFVFVAPVMFWALEVDTYAPYPVTMDGVQVSNVRILTPCGKVIDRLGDIYLNFAGFLKDIGAENAQIEGVPV